MKNRKPVSVGTSQEAPKERRVVRDYFSEEEVQGLIRDAKAMARSNPQVLKFLIEQIHGRSPQRVELSADARMLDLGALIQSRFKGRI